MFKYVQWAIFLLIFLPFLIIGTQNNGFGFSLIAALVFATIGTFLASLFLRPVWYMFAEMFGKD